MLWYPHIYRLKWSLHAIDSNISQQSSGGKLVRKVKETQMKLGEVDISQIEFDYIKTLLNTLNSSAHQNRLFKKGFWFIQERTLGYRYRPQRQIPGIFQQLGTLLQGSTAAAQA